MSTELKPASRDPSDLLGLFMGYGEPELSSSERELWLRETALRLAKIGTRGVNCLLAFAPYADVRQAAQTAVANLTSRKLP